MRSFSSCSLLLELDVSVFLRRPLLALRSERPKPGNEELSCVARPYDCVNDSSLRRDEGIREFASVFFREPFEDSFVLRFFNLLSVNDSRGALRSHDSNLSARPSIVQIRPREFASHSAVGPTVSLPHYHSDLRYSCLAVSKEKFRAVFYYTS